MAHDLTSTTTVHTDKMLKEVKEFVECAEKEYNLIPGMVARFEESALYLFNDLYNAVNINDPISLGRKNNAEWNSFFYGF